jgi:ribosome biogenesis GTPase
MTVDMQNITLHLWGWNEQWQAAFVALGLAGAVPGRVTTEHKGMYRVVTEQGELLIEVSGKLRHAAVSREDYPAVGDWVAVQPMAGDHKGIAHAVLPRTSKFSRKSAGGKTVEQIVAANVDTVLLVNALNQDFNLRRLERYLILAWESGANPVIVLTKADLSDRVEQQVLEVERVAAGVPVIVTSMVNGDGVERVRGLARAGVTLAMLGSSGAGKSSLVNALLGREAQVVQDVREGDDRGRHTTTHRELFLLQGGGAVVDTPGMRELQLWHADEGFSEAFDDIESLMSRCRFSDCTHRGERDCAVQAALDTGELDDERYANYMKLQKELAYLARREDGLRRQQEKATGKKHAKFLKEHYRGRR